MSNDNNPPSDQSSDPESEELKSLNLDKVKKDGSMFDSKNFLDDRWSLLISTGGGGSGGDGDGDGGGPGGMDVYDGK